MLAADKDHRKLSNADHVSRKRGFKGTNAVYDVYGDRKDQSTIFHDCGAHVVMNAVKSTLSLISGKEETVKRWDYNMS
jgi:hypothetical protein